MIEETAILTANEPADTPPIVEADNLTDDVTDGVTQTEIEDGEPLPSDGRSERIDYARVAKEDLIELQAQFPALRGLGSVAELPNPLRYGALRDLGLTPREAYLATSPMPAPRHDNRAHLRSSIPKGRVGDGARMSSSELESARILFGNLSDAEIHRLYRKVQA